MCNSVFGKFGGANPLSIVIIGKQGEQPFQISDGFVSRRHCEITTTAQDGVFHIKDLDSSNGTFVNGYQIVECDVTYKDRVTLGERYELDLHKIFPQVERKQSVYGRPSKQPSNQLSQKTSPQSSGNAAFPSHLKRIYNDNIEQKQKILSAQRWGMVWRIFVPQIFTQALMPLLKIEGGLGPAIGLVVGILITVIITKATDSSSKKMEEINTQFQMKYVCGNCNRFLGTFSPEYFENNLKCQCPYCKQTIK